MRKQNLKYMTLQELKEGANAGSRLIYVDFESIFTSGSTLNRVHRNRVQVGGKSPKFTSVSSFEGAPIGSHNVEAMQTLIAAGFDIVVLISELYDHHSIDIMETYVKDSLPYRTRILTTKEAGHLGRILEDAKGRAFVYCGAAYDDISISEFAQLYVTIKTAPNILKKEANRTLNRETFFSDLLEDLLEFKVMGVISEAQQKLLKFVLRYRLQPDIKHLISMGKISLDGQVNTVLDVMAKNGADDSLLIDFSTIINGYPAYRDFFDPLNRTFQPVYINGVCMISEKLTDILKRGNRSQANSIYMLFLRKGTLITDEIMKHSLYDSVDIHLIFKDFEDYEAQIEAIDREYGTNMRSDF